jgi:heme-degrading monooxygenase HmoA
VTAPDPAVAVGPIRGGFVAHSELRVAVAGAPALIAAFEQRLGEVERWPGFERLEVWQDERDDGRFVMVSWWDDKESFSAYMRSQSHHRSHARVPSGSGGPRPVSFSRYRLVAR